MWMTLHQKDECSWHFTSRLIWNLGLKWPFWVGLHHNSQLRAGFGAPLQIALRFQESKKCGFAVHPSTEWRSPSAFIPDWLWLYVFPQQCSAAGACDNCGYSDLYRIILMCSCLVYKTSCTSIVGQVKHLLFRMQLSDLSALHNLCSQSVATEWVTAFAKDTVWKMLEYLRQRYWYWKFQKGWAVTEKYKAKWQIIFFNFIDITEKWLCQFLISGLN